MFCSRRCCFRFQLFALSLLFLQVACSGGGGGESGPSFTVAASVVNFEAFDPGTAPATQTVDGAISGVDQSVFLFVVLPSTDVVRVANVSLNPDGRSGELRLVPQFPSITGVGTFEETIVVRACLDRACNDEIDGSPKQITVVYDVLPAPLIDPGRALVGDFAQGGTPPGPSPIGFDGAATSGWTARVEYTNGSGWVDVSPTSGSSLPGVVSIRTSMAGLPLGVYRANVLVETNDGRGAFSIPVTITVVEPAIEVTRVPLSFVLSRTSPETDRERRVRVAANSVSPIPWTADPDVPWLTLDPSSGDGTTSVDVDVTVNEGYLALLGDDYAAQITFSSTAPNVSDQTIDVELDLSIPRARIVAPQVGYAGWETPIWIRGAGFNAIPDLSAVTIGGETPVSIERVSDTEIRATTSALSAGEHEIDFGLTATIPVARDALTVIESWDFFDPTFVPFVGLFQHVAVDEERKTIYLTRDSENRLWRLRYTGIPGIEWEPESVLLPGIPTSPTSLTPPTISQDGKWVALLYPDFANRASKLFVVSTETMTIDTTLPNLPPDREHYGVHFLNTGELILLGFVGSDLYDPYTGEQRSLSSPCFLPMDIGASSVSRAGTFVIRPEPSSTTSPSVCRYSASDDDWKYVKLGLYAATTSVIDDGSRLAAGTQVFPTNPAAINSTPIGTLPSVIAQVFPTSRLAYVRSSTPLGNRQNSLKAYDIDAAPFPGGAFAEVPELAVGVPRLSRGIHVTGDEEWVVTHDGSTFLIQRIPDPGAQ